MELMASVISELLVLSMQQVSAHAHSKPSFLAWRRNPWIFIERKERGAEGGDSGAGCDMERPLSVSGRGGGDGSDNTCAGCAEGEIDSEGEVRGMWKRHLRMENYWVMGGYTQQHRWHSRTVALQIKAALEGILPPAYRKTPY